jgi:hypothetical protein
MGFQDFFNWRSQTAAANTDAVADDEPAAEVDEPPDHHISFEQPPSDFHKTAVRAKMGDRKESLLTKALLRSPEAEEHKPEIHVATDLSRRRSMISNASMASTAELTSDGGLTSPARTNTPSPPPPGAFYASFAPYSLSTKPALAPRSVTSVDVKDGNLDTALRNDAISVSPTSTPRPALPKKRCISFVCGGKKEATAAPVSREAAPAPTITIAAEAPKPEKPKRMISFQCSGGKPKVRDDKLLGELGKDKSVGSPKRLASRSPSIPRKFPRGIPQPSPGSRQDSITVTKRAPQSPNAARAKPRCIIANEKTFGSSEATRFHEFASEEPQEDDWIREEVKITSKMTINDTLKMENAIRKLGNEAEEEAMEEDEEDDDDEDETVDYSEDDEDDEGDEDDEEEDEDDEDASDGNETDNEAGFADSDESDVEGEFAFWTPGRNVPHTQIGEPSTYRPSAHRAASASSIDSVSYIESNLGPKTLRRPLRRPVKIRPGTPELPDSTDFVCGTLDEDRPMENAYIQCMKARENAKHKQTPQDIDPSFPTSDLDEEDEEDNVIGAADDSDEPVWLHGNFEESDNETKGRSRQSTIRRKSPIVSPRRLHSPPPPARRLHSPPPPRRHHSPPPPKQRLRSPPPRKLFGQSPRRLRSPPPARAVHSPAGTPMHSTNGAVSFMSLASRPGLTHTKSLPRAPNIFGRQYKASRIVAATGNGYDNSDGPDGHVRGAIDIVKGLEQKRQRRKEKFLQKHGNRKQKGHTERKPQPGKGAERMRELGLLMAGKTGATDPYMLSA